jgi:hypothetical protein
MVGPDINGDWLETILANRHLKSWVARYFDRASAFAGDLFDEFGANIPERFDGDDLLAVTFLNVVVPPLAARHLVQDHAVDKLLSAIPWGVDLWDANEADIEKATELWSELAWGSNFPGIGEVTAGKLLARKRPRLVPIVDRVVRKIVPARPGHYWETIAETLRSEETRIRLEDLRPPGVRVTTLRLLDVAIWMSDSESRNARRVRQDIDDDEGAAR